MRRNCFTILFCATLASSAATAQVTIPLQDNWQPPDNSWTRIAPATYQMSDTEKDGVIQIVNKHNVTIDGDSVFVHGTGLAGYFISIINSDSVTIRNFGSADGFFYAVNARNSQHVAIMNCTFSNNRKDSLGYINVWTDVDQALGGGVLMDSCSWSRIQGTTMKNSNDGVALYHCDSITIDNNDLSWNTSFGVRMFWTNRSWIHHNDCSHTNRLTDQSDCGAILLIVSNQNRVEYNDVTYSGDGIFLGQYGFHSIPNNNYFAYNDGSYSPHNAFEATFASGNVFKHNRANHSDYGFWLGYSFNTIVDSNEIMNNQTAGIAVDRGFHNRIRFDTIAGNPTGIWLWEGDPIPGYTSWNSNDYDIEGCILTENGTAVSSSNTEDLMMLDDSVAYNANGVHLDGSAAGTMINECRFDRNILFHIENGSPADIQAENNWYSVGDTVLIEAKIFDKEDNPNVGTVFWKPFHPGPTPVIHYRAPVDLAEPPAIWSVYASDGRSSALSWDSVDRKTGNASLKLVTQSGFDVTIHYWPETHAVASWDISGATSLTVWLKTANVHPFQANSVRIGNESGGYFSYDAPASILTNTQGVWRQYVIPLGGDATWQRSVVGNVSLSNISYVELHADTWDAGFTLWIDGLSFDQPQDVALQSAKPRAYSLSQSYPNPFNPATTIRYELPVTSYVALRVYDALGRQIAELADGLVTAGVHSVTFTSAQLSSGVYLYRLEARPLAGGQVGSFSATKKMILLH
jgi:hypothetical protein